MILKSLEPTFEEGMQYGLIGYFVPHRVYPPGYHCDPKQPLPFICLARQKNSMSVYLGSVQCPEREKLFRAAWEKTGKKLDMGKSCVRFKKLKDLALDVLGDSIRRVSAQAFIQDYESAIQKQRRRPTRKTAAKSARTKDPKGKVRSEPQRNQGAKVSEPESQARQPGQGKRNSC